MGFSKYPRFGQRIAPATLQDILNADIPPGLLSVRTGKFNRLADLDESVWQTESEQICETLACLVVREVHKNLRRLPVMLRISSLPASVPKIPLALLDLQVRTYNALKSRFGGEVPSETLIRDLLNIGGIGACTIVDVLVSIEAFSTRPQQTQQLELQVQTEPPLAVSLGDFPSRIDVEISHYPRRGHRIAPKVLSSLLSVSAGDRRLGSQRLCDLDEATWDRLSPKICHKLAISVIGRVKAFRNTLHKMGGQIKLPVPRTNGKPIVLQLEQRTFNCLQERGLWDNPCHLAEMTVADLLAISGFGEKCVVDLLSSLESQIAETYAPNPKVLALAQKLSRSKAARCLRLDDLRFGPLLQALRIRGETLQEICDVILAGTTCPMNAEFFARRLAEVFSRIHAAHRMQLETELLDLLAFEPKVRNRDVTMRLFGWDGRGVKTLKTIGKAFNMTRERIRQISQHQVDRIQENSQYLPILDRAIEIVTASTPSLESTVIKALTEKRLTKEPFRISGILNAAEVTGRNCPFIVDEREGSRYIVPRAAGDLTKQILQMARKAISQWGVTTIEDVAAEVCNVVGKPVSSEFVKILVSGQSSFAWLDIASGWFWMKSTGRNPLLNETEKILSVCERIHVTELRSGVSRNRRREGFAPPQRVLLAFCAQVGPYKVSGNFVSADPPLEFADILADTEKTFVKVFRRIGPLVQLHRLEEECLRQGMNQATFGAYLSNSPIISRFARCVYGLRGTEAPPGLAESLGVERRKTRVLSDYGWTQDGKVFLAYILSSGTIANGIVSVPTGMKHYVSGEFDLRVTEGAPIGRLVVKNSQAWGLGPLFRRRGGDPGDSLRILFDLKTRIATAELGQVSTEEDDGRT